MKFILTSLIILTFSLQAYATTIKIVGANNQVILEERLETHFTNVGELTHSVLENALQTQNIFEYQGSFGGVQSINNMGNHIEVISETEIKAYGWCYKVDGIAPDVMADGFALSGEEEEIEWFWVYAHMRDGVWISMCTPATKSPQK